MSLIRVCLLMHDAIFAVPSKLTDCLLSLDIYFSFCYALVKSTTFEKNLDFEHDNEFIRVSRTCMCLLI